MKEHVVMKKSYGFLIVSVFIFLLNASLFSESDSPGATARKLPLFEGGVKGGLSMASFFWTGDHGWNNSTMFAFLPALWGFCDVNLTDTVGIELNAGYAGKGCSVDASDGYLHWYYHYLDFPVFIKWQTQDPSMRFYASAGGYFSKLLSGSYDFGVSGSSYFDGKGAMTIGTNDSPTFMHPYDYGLLFEFRFTVSLSPAMEFTPPEEYGGSRGALNSGIMLIAGYKL